MPVPSTDMLARSKYLTAPTTIAATTATARSTQLTPGMYAIVASADCFFLQGGSAVDATTSSVPLYAKTYVRLHVETGSDYVAAITASGTATVYIVPLSG